MNEEKGGKKKFFNILLLGTIAGLPFWFTSSVGAIFSTPSEPWIQEASLASVIEQELAIPSDRV